MNREILLGAAKAFPDKLPPPFAEMSETLGAETVLEFAEYFGGSNIYVPKARGLFAGCLLSAARKDFNGYNLNEVARKYGFSVRYLSNVLRKGQNEK